MTIDELRRRIDQLDERLVELLNERASCALEIGRLKQTLGLEVYQPEREAEVLRLIASGKTTKQIATLLVVSVGICGMGSAANGSSPRGQSPRNFSASANTVSGLTAPVTMSAVLLGT